MLLLLLQVLLFLCVSLTALCASGGAKKENEQSAGATEHTHTDVDTCEQEKYILFSMSIPTSWKLHFTQIAQKVAKL